jgi:bacteriorhodopsin
MQNAGFDSIIRTLLIIFLMYYVLKFLAKIFLPIILKKVVEKAGQNFHQYGPNQNTQNTQAQEEIIVDAAKSKNPKETKKVGEYVDYEEID